MSTGPPSTVTSASGSPKTTRRNVATWRPTTSSGGLRIGGAGLDLPRSGGDTPGSQAARERHETEERSQRDLALALDKGVGRRPYESGSQREPPAVDGQLPGQEPGRRNERDEQPRHERELQAPEQLQRPAPEPPPDPHRYTDADLHPRHAGPGDGSHQEDPDLHHPADQGDHRSPAEGLAGVDVVHQALRSASAALVVKRNRLRSGAWTPHRSLLARTAGRTVLKRCARSAFSGTT